MSDDDMLAVMMDTCRAITERDRFEHASAETLSTLMEGLAQ